MSDPQLVRFFHPDVGVALGLRREETVAALQIVTSITDWLRGSVGRVEAAIDDLNRIADVATLVYPASAFDGHSPGGNDPHWLAPVDEQDVWAAGVTYARSRAARQEEAVDGGDIYARVYAAERPELFFKAHGRAVIGPGGTVGIREDATWSVPEPELALVLNPAMEVVGLMVGNDMSSRDIEGENPLYLPQAKVYTASCALGPGIRLGVFTEWPLLAISITIWRGEQMTFNGKIHTTRIHRTLDDLVSYLGRSNTFPHGVVLLTGTGIVPPAEFTLQADDEVAIAIESIGTLTNTVGVV